MSQDLKASPYKAVINFINQFQTLTNTGLGRDKATKVIQYGCKIIEEILERSASPTVDHKDLIVRVQRTSAGLATARRVMRFWKPFQGYVALIQFIEALISGKKQTVTAILDLVSKLCMAHYFLVDHLTWLSREKILSDMPLELAQKSQSFFASTFNNNKNADYSRIGSNFWFYGVVFAILAHVLRWSEYLTKEKKEFDIVRDANQQKMFRTLIALFCDFGTAAILAKKTTFQNKAALGVFGVVSSLISIYDAWPSQ
ncbi:hypothetical protein FDP41_007871 [Naegleria fowleri]|uniref:Uncharacterized protein n=1 Tax=Naegleria fowleri TaxID=5763 RepID=A0A6A5C871_NAEFO|nr:Peroxin 11a (Pex11a), putative [Naegleria fowleri]KAF0983956.1 hypothetical protein FDP41_007871 [Naegleria fowleri]CAG4716956.1 unnamed protein product [Naegleria fowleri]